MRILLAACSGIAVVAATPALATDCVTAPANVDGVIIPAKQVVWLRPKEHFVYQPSHTDGPQEGTVRLDCVFKPDGGLTACRILEETPTDEDFADNALKFFSSLHADMARSCAMSGMHVEVTMRFKEAG